ncbi:hypothetical protein ILYODFUR_032485 [Ilyodon furcidens]
MSKQSYIPDPPELSADNKQPNNRARVTKLSYSLSTLFCLSRLKVLLPPFPFVRRLQLLGLHVQAAPPPSPPPTSQGSHERLGLFPERLRSCSHVNHVFTAG